MEQVIRPTGLVDPPVEVRPVKGQIDDLLHEIRDRVSRGERVLVTTLTKRMAEDLAEYYSEVGVKCRYMHSEIEVLERVKILRDLRKGEFDVLIGINLLREGLDLPEVSLVAVLDADKEGFLRSAGSRQHLANKFTAIHTGVDVTCTRKLKDFESGNTSQATDNLFSGFAGRLSQTLREFESQWQRKLTESNLRGLFHYDIRQV